MCGCMEATDACLSNSIPSMEMLQRSSAQDWQSGTLVDWNHVIHLFVPFPSCISHHLSFLYTQISPCANSVTPPMLSTRMRHFFDMASLAQCLRNPHWHFPWSFWRFISNYAGFAHDSVLMPLQRPCVIFWEASWAVIRLGSYMTSRQTL